MQNCFHPNHSAVLSVPRRVSCKQLPVHPLPRKLPESSAHPIHFPSAESCLNPACNWQDKVLSPRGVRNKDEKSALMKNENTQKAPATEVSWG